MNEREIEREAAEVLAAHGVRGLPVDPLGIAAAEGIRVASGHFDECFDGRIEYYRRGERGAFYLFYAEGRLPDRPPGRVRFSVGHELGHYFLPHHRRALTAGRWHASHADFASDDPMEREADRFAAAMLMPRTEFVKQVERCPRSVCTIADLRRLADGAFMTSLSSTVNRYIELDFEPCAVVVSENGRVKTAYSSRSMRSLGLGWIEFGSPIPVTSATHLAATAAARTGQWDTGAEVDSGVWFEGTASRALWEDVRVLGDRRTLTLLTLADDGDGDE